MSKGSISKKEIPTTEKGIRKKGKEEEEEEEEEEVFLGSVGIFLLFLASLLFIMQSFLFSEMRKERKGRN
jgi:hypothetical protein